MFFQAVGTTNGTLSTSSTSGSNSRRDSVGTIPKCDNVKKCPDKKQIEDKLNQIREYLRVTTSLMSSIKNNEDQVNFYFGILKYLKCTPFMIHYLVSSCIFIFIL